MSPNKSLEDLKKWALISGFPLENDVFKVLQSIANHTPIVERDVPFPATDDKGKDLIRSIDFKCSIQKPIENFPRFKGEKGIVSLNFIVDAKYTSDKDKHRFWFVPSGKTAADLVFPYLVPQARCKSDFGEVHYNSRKDLKGFASCPPTLRLASTGRKVSELNGERDSLVGYQVQALEATAHFIQEEYDELGKADSVTGGTANSTQFYIPIIATNAPLFILRAGINIEEVERAKNAKEICDDVDYLLVEAPNIHHLKAMLGSLTEKVRNHGSSTKWLFPDFQVAPVVFCGISALKTLLESFVTQYDALPAKI